MMKIFMFIVDLCELYEELDATLILFILLQRGMVRNVINRI